MTCWGFANTISLLSLLVSSATFLLGCFAYKKFLVKQAQQKQLDIVLDLIKQIHEDRNRYIKSERHSNLEPTLVHKAVNLFEIATDPFFNKNEKLFFIKEEQTETMQIPVHLGDGLIYKQPDILNWDFFYDFHTNPLLPKKIARKLKVFDIDRYCSVDSTGVIFANGSFLIGNRDLSQVKTIIGSTYTPISHADAFQRSAQELKQVIIDWMESYGIKDINLMED